MADPDRNDDFPVHLSCGSLRAEPAQGWVIPHVWTDDGVVVRTQPNGAGVLHVAVALCVLNDLYRESETLGVPVDGVRVGARGEFDTETWVSTGISYVVDVASAAPADQVAALVARVDEVAEIPRALRAGMAVERTDA